MAWSAAPSERPTVVLSTASPYKFPAAVLGALGGEGSADEFETMRRLERETGVPIPAGLRDLEKKPVLHRDVIERDRMHAYVRSRIENWR